MDKENKSPLRSGKVTVRMIPRKSELFEGEKHVLSGGMAETTVYGFTVPKDGTGMYKKVLDDDEAAWLENSLGMDAGAMSPHRRDGNFWTSRNPLCNVELGKNDTVLDLSNPEDYIKYKILLANDAVICDGMDALEKRPKATYRFVLAHETEELKSMSNRVTVKMECYKAFGKIEDDKYKLKTVIELLDSTVLTPNTSIEWLKEQCISHIDNEPKRFLQFVRDPLLDEKIFVKKLVDAGLVSNRSGRMFVRKGDVPMCDNGEEATLAMAAKWISDPKRQDLRLLLEAQLNGEDVSNLKKK